MQPQRDKLPGWMLVLPFGWGGHFGKSLLPVVCAPTYSTQPSVHHSGTPRPLPETEALPSAVPDSIIHLLCTEDENTLLIQSQ